MFFPSLLRVTHKLLNLRGGRQRRAVRPGRGGVRLCLEAVEDRLLLANCVWASNQSGLWIEPANWFTCNGVTPGPGDTARIDRSGVTVEFPKGAGSLNVASIQTWSATFIFNGDDLNVSQSVSAFGGRLRVNAAGTVRAGGGLGSAGATLELVSGDLGTTQVSADGGQTHLGPGIRGGFITLTGVTQSVLCGSIPRGTNVTIRSGFGEHRVALCDGQRDLENGGRLQLNAGVRLIVPGELQNLPGARLITPTQQFTPININVGTLVNQREEGCGSEDCTGLIILDGGLGISGTLRNYGEVRESASLIVGGFVNEATGYVIAALRINTQGSAFDNQGTLEVRAGIQPVTIANGLTNSGTVLVGAGARLFITGGYTQTDGLTSLAGTLHVVTGVYTQNDGLAELAGPVIVENGSGTFRINGGTVHGYSTIHAFVRNGARLEVGGPGAPGYMEIWGGYEQTGTGTLAIDIGGTRAIEEYDVLAVFGTAQLAGTLEVHVAEAYQPAPGDWAIFLCATEGLFGDFGQTKGWPGYGFIYEGCYYLAFK